MSYYISNLSLFVRKLIEGEDSRLSSMVQTLATTGGAHLAAGGGMCAGAVSDSDTSAPTTTEQDKPSNGSKVSDPEEQGTKTSETKTVLIR